MAPAPQSSEPKSTPGAVVADGQRFASSMLHLPANVYLLLFFTLGKGFQLTMPSGLYL
jgi:hypothetical protein